MLITVSSISLFQISVISVLTSFQFYKTGLELSSDTTKIGVTDYSWQNFSWLAFNRRKKNFLGLMPTYITFLSNYNINWTWPKQK